MEPTALGRLVAGSGVSVVALTDHDTTAGLAEFAAAATGILVVPGIELTCRVRAGTQGTVHVLGYGVDSDSVTLADVARRNRLGKRANVRAILEQIERKERIALSWEEVAGANAAGDAYVGRNHVASALVRAGAVRSRQRAFRRFLRSERVPIVDVASAEEALVAIHDAGGVSVLAHPNQIDLEHHLKPLVRLGLQGIEVFRPRVMERRRSKLLALAEKHGLLVSGGSDWHGHHPEPPYGTWRAPADALSALVSRWRP